MTAGNVCIRESGVWKKKTTAQDLIDDVVTTLGDNTHEEVARDILNLCLHVLSPNHVGATLVWAVDRTTVPRSGANRITSRHLWM